MKIIDCPRDAMQGVEDFIDTELKIEYINKILAVGFDTVDFGSFVSPKAIPQMKDTETVLDELDLTISNTSLLAIIANARGAEKAMKYEEIEYLGYPFSVSETFQRRNTNSSIEESLQIVENIQSLTYRKNKELVVYLSMAFGNPYDDEYSPEIVAEWFEKMAQLGVEKINLSDTIGSATPELITDLFNTLIPAFPNVEIGAHFHTTPDTWEEKVDAAYKAGCQRFDGAIKGYGGCPMAKDELTGNMPTEKLIDYMSEKGEDLGLNLDAFGEAMEFANKVFGKSTE